ncbi:MAG TPA: transposase [Methylomirabilota bacterium]
MTRPRRYTFGGHVYHVLNRGIHRQTLFARADDYLYFQELMLRAAVRVPMRIVAYCLMPNHWHLVLWPELDGAISAYIQWLAGTHACYFNTRHSLTGHVYQGRFKAVSVGDERHLLTLLRYVEANPVRAGLVQRAEDWMWSSVGEARLSALTDRLVTRPANWLDILAGSAPEPARRSVVLGS